VDNETREDWYVDEVGSEKKLLKKCYLEKKRHPNERNGNESDETVTEAVFLFIVAPDNKKKKKFLLVGCLLLSSVSKRPIQLPLKENQFFSSVLSFKKAKLFFSFVASLISAFFFGK
jgi:hypothetical protein